MTSRSEFLEALRDLPAKHRAWLAEGDVELWCYYGLGIVLTSAQLEHIREILTWPPGTIHVWRWANRTGKTTGLDVFYGWASWYKWRYENADFDDWLRFRYKSLHAAPLGELAGKAYELWEEIIAGSAKQQQNPITNRQRPALLRPFFTATKTVDATGVDRPAVECANGSVIDFRSTQGGAARIESDSWWNIGWDEFPRQAPAEQIPVIFDQTLLPRSSDYMAPVIMAGTATIGSEHIYVELEEIASHNPSDWNFTTAARSSNFAQTKASIDRQVRLAIDKETAERSVHGQFGSGIGGMFPHFLLANAFVPGLPETLAPPVDEQAWDRFEDRYTFLTAFDHALAGDDNVLLTLAVPWPPSTIDPGNPIVGAHIEFIRSSRTLTPDEQQFYLSREVRSYRSRVAIIDATAEGGLGVYRSAMAAGLPALDCNMNGRAAKWVTNKEFGLQGLQRLLSYGLPVPDGGFIEEWPDPEGSFGVLRFPQAGNGWQKLRRQLAVYKRADEKLRQDAASTLTMLGWYLWKLIAHAAAPKRQPFNIMATRTGNRRRFG